MSAVHAPHRGTPHRRACAGQKPAREKTELHEVPATLFHLRKIAGSEGSGRTLRIAQFGLHKVPDRRFCVSRLAGVWRVESEESGEDRGEDCLSCGVRESGV